jgi:hypothetical protein
VHELTTLADLFSAMRLNATAEKFLKLALAGPQLSVDVRLDLLRRLAELQDQVADRGKILLEIYALQPAGSPQAEHEINLLLALLSRPDHAALAAEWAAKIDDPRLQSRLLLRHAQLTGDSSESGDLLWQAYQRGGLPEFQLEAASQTWNTAEQWPRTIDALERLLRTGHQLKPSVRRRLAEAYKGAGRDFELRRAETHDVDANPATLDPGPPQRGGGFF